MAKCTADLEIFACAAISRSEGSLSPGFSSPLTIMPAMRSMNICRTVGVSMMPISMLIPVLLSHSWLLLLWFVHEHMT